MKVKLTTARSGTDGSYPSGAEIDVSTAEAGRLIQSNQAIPVRDDTAQREEATARAPRKNTRKRSK